MATTQDAEVMLRFYDLRREERLRKAREFAIFKWKPQTPEEFLAYGGKGTAENAMLRQVVSYWEMGASLVLRGAIDADLFLDSNTEGLVLRAKFARFHEVYEAKEGGRFMVNTAKMIEQFPRAATIYEKRKAAWQ